MRKNHDEAHLEMNNMSIKSGGQYHDMRSGQLGEHKEERC